MADVINIAAVDDDRMLLEGMRSWLGPVPDLVLCATATTVDEYLAGPRTADVVLLDLNLRDFSSPPDNVRRIRRTGAEVLVVSSIPDAEHVLATLEAGAAGYVTKDHDLDTLADAVRRVAEGGSAVTPELAFIISQDHRPRRPALSPQELAVLSTYATGSTLATAARRAGIAYGTAREYLERVKRKYAELGRPARTKVDLVTRLREDRLELHRLPDP